MKRKEKQNMNNFRTHDVAMTLYKECQKLKITNLIVKDQFERASLSIVLNLAEGVGRRTKKDRKRFYSIALGSLEETRCILKIIESPQETLKLADKTGAHLYKLIQNPGGA
jgi:four helix bundle protein